MTLHVVSLPHTRVAPDFCGCAFTAKVLKFCKMMWQDKIFLYAPEGPPVLGAELVPCLTDTARQTIFGMDDRHRLPAWPTQDQSKVFHANVIQEIRKRVSKHDLILLVSGWTAHSVKDAFPEIICCEPGVGYAGICTDKCAFESYAWQHTVYAKNKIEDGRWFDTVIPNYFDIDDFPHINPGNGKYLLFLGRLISRKGPHIASDIAKACGMPLVVAGAGGRQVGKDIVAPEITIKDAEYVGPVNIQERSKLLSGAHALLVPTTYIEPFGGVAIEAMLSGTPVVATDWGAFPETVRGCGGFRFRSLSEGVQAVEWCRRLLPYAIRDYAIKYTLPFIRPEFSGWFQKLQTIWSDGWYQKSVTSLPRSW